MNILTVLKKKLGKSSLGKNITLIAGGTAFAQTLGIIFSPIITRIYPPDQYGILTTYMAILGLLVISASLDYHKAMPIEKDESKAVNLLALSIFFLVVTVLIITCLLVFFGEFFIDKLNIEVLTPYKFIIPFGVFFVGIYDVLLQWSYRERSYKIITRTTISQSLAGNFTKVMLGLLKLGPVGLILGFIMGQSAGITSLALPLVKQKRIITRLSIQKIKYVLMRYKNFPLYSAPSNYVYLSGNNIPIILLTTMFDSSVTGFFGLANNIIRLPLNLIGSSIAQVFYSEAANIGKSNPRKIKNIGVNLIKKMALIGILPLVTLVLFGPWLFSLVFGVQWYQAGIYARILSVMVYFHFIISPIGRILEIFERQRAGLIFNLIRLGMVLLVFIIAKVFNFNSYHTVALYALSNSISYVGLLILFLFIINIEIKKDMEVE